ncbi:MAG: alpha/beta hydrolase [Oscillospiraceae bacterium]|nr:alpha/beta hydrolase [Oscillospiraceae bacterium]
MRISIKKLMIILAVILAVLLITDILIGNYLVSFAIVRKANKGKSVAPESAMTSEADKIKEENIKLLSEQTQIWMESASVKTAEIQSDDGLCLKGDMINSETDSRLWVILVHGYQAQKGYMYDYAYYYAEKNFNILLPDMRSHGESEGSYIGMGWLDRKDLLKWIALILEQDAQAEIILHGVSMGGATVMMTAGETLPENIKAVIDDCGYTSVWDIFSDELNYLFQLPDFPFLYTADKISKLRAGYSFSEASALEQIRKTEVPVMFIHGSADNFVHTEMVYQLYDACPTQKELYVCENAGHALSLYMNPEVYNQKVFAFLDNYLI